MDLKRQKLYSLIISVSLFLASLLTTPFLIDSDNPRAWPIGLWCLLLGWFSLGTLAGIAWLANPFILLAWFFALKRVTVSSWLSGIAFLFSILFLFSDEVIANEAGGVRKIRSVEIGYYLWLASITFFLIATIILSTLEKKYPPINQHPLDRGQ